MKLQPAVQCLCNAQENNYKVLKKLKKELSFRTRIKVFKCIIFKHHHKPNHQKQNTYYKMDKNNAIRKIIAYCITRLQ